MNKVICPECAANDQLSRVYDGGGSSTLMAFHPYWDEKGDYHFHDGNRRTRSYHCSKGHRWEDGYTAPCPQGDYP